ncbi:MAG TPA: transglutaminase domain-containing protein [Mucilaginibacter sp.]|nr:transglutaminase domain-containing protein [Mucilaginibacter sp.]
MKKTLLLSLILFLTTSVFAQDFPYGEPDIAALGMKKYDKDTSAHAVVLNEHGISRISLTNDYHIRLNYEYHTKIKFFDNKDFDEEGTFVIQTYNGDGTSFEEVEDIKGITYYKDENGIIQKVELDPKKVISEKRDKHYTLVKFTMPALRSGCVVEVSYHFITPFFRNFHPWHFQSYIPKIYSEYEAHIPGLWSFNASLMGYLKLTKNTANIESKCFTFGSSSADCSYMVYGMSDIPAFKPEDYMTAEKNYKSAIYFELEEETSLETGAKIKYAKEWRDIDYDLKTERWFGGQLKRNGLMKDRIAPIIANKTDQMEKAQIIYDYIKNTIKWNEDEDFGSDDGIRQALINHTGNAGDINLALVTALNAGGIPTEAVLLSTREHGVISKLYPSIGDFNYVVARAQIGDKSYLLDATEPLLPFGMLPMRCLNDQGRVFSLDKPSYWIDLSSNQRESVTYALDLSLQDDGKMKGTITRFSIGYSGYLRRKEIKKFNSVNEYVESIAEKLRKTKVIKSDIVNIDSLDKPVGETYEVEMSLYDNLNHDKLTFSPFLLNQVTINPFKLTERDFPVDWGMPSDERYIINVHLPKQYVLENPPQAMAITMPNKGGNFFTEFDGDNQTFSFSYDTRLNKSIYSPEEYPYLKELYNKIILAQKNEFVFKKK